MRGFDSFEVTSTVCPDPPDKVAAIASPVVPFCPFVFRVPLLQPNSRRRVPLFIRGYWGTWVNGDMRSLPGPQQLNAIPKGPCTQTVHT